jgi:hypothetical protein
MQHVDGSCWRWWGEVTVFLFNNGNAQVYMSGAALVQRINRSGRVFPPVPVPCGVRVLSGETS